MDAAESDPRWDWTTLTTSAVSTLPYRYSSRPQHSPDRVVGGVLPSSPCTRTIYVTETFQQTCSLSLSLRSRDTIRWHAYHDFTQKSSQVQMPLTAVEQKQMQQRLFQGHGMTAAPGGTGLGSLGKTSSGRNWLQFTVHASCTVWNITAWLQLHGRVPTKHEPGECEDRAWIRGWGIAAWLLMGCLTSRE